MYNQVNNKIRKIYVFLFDIFLHIFIQYRNSFHHIMVASDYYGIDNRRYIYIIVWRRSLLPQTNTIKIRVIQVSDQINRPTQESEVAVELENQPSKIVF